jgi:hypothetical protein
MRVAITALGIGLAVILGGFGVGVWLVAEGLSRSSQTFAALGVLLVIVTLMSSAIGTWRVTGVGFSLEHTSAHQAASSQFENDTLVRALREALASPSLDEVEPDEDEKPPPELGRAPDEPAIGAFHPGSASTGSLSDSESDWTR